MRIFGLRLRPLVGMATVAVLLGSGAASAAPVAEPELRLVASAGSVVLDRYEVDGPVAVLDLGTYVVAGAQPVEIRSKRASYRDPIVARKRSASGGQVSLPAGLVDDLSGLSDFVHVTFADDGGDVVQELDVDFCPNMMTIRVDAGGPETSPYPNVCGSNPFALGAVWGIPAGWGAATMDQTEYGDEVLTVPDGDYTVTVSVNPVYRRVFGIRARDAAVQVRAQVRTVDIEAAPLRAAGGVFTGTRPTGAQRVPAVPKPDLRALPAWWIEVGEDGESLSFDSTIWNAGGSPLVVDGFRQGGTMEAVQYFYDPAGAQVGYAVAGTMEWEDGDVMGHWSFTGLVRYRLLTRAGRVVAESGATGHCFSSSEPIDYTVARADWRPNEGPLSTSCSGRGALGARQVLDVGNGDTYAQFLPGRAIDVSGVPNGTYLLEVAVNPEGLLHESDTRNNVSARRVVLGGTPGERTVEVPPHQGIDR